MEAKLRWTLIFLLAACAQPDTTTRLAMVNPASVNCTAHDGKLMFRQSAAGTSGYCQLQDGRSVDEWEYFRQTNP